MAGPVEGSGEVRERVGEEREVGCGEVVERGAEEEIICRRGGRRRSVGWSV